MQGLAGPVKVGFSQPTYLCESETAWRNNALVYFMMKAGVFAKDVDPLQSLDFYLQACSIGELNRKVYPTFIDMLPIDRPEPYCISIVSGLYGLFLTYDCQLFVHTCVLLYLLLPNTCTVCTSRSVGSRRGDSQGCCMCRCNPRDWWHHATDRGAVD